MKDSIQLLQYYNNGLLHLTDHRSMDYGSMNHMICTSDYKNNAATATTRKE